MSRTRVAPSLIGGLAVAASVLALGLGSASGQTGPSGVAAAPAATSTRVAVVAVRGPNGALYVHREGTIGFVKLGGQISAAPSVVATGGVTYYVAGVPGGNIYARTDALPWQPMRPAGTVNCRQPGASVRGTTIVVGCQGTNNGLYMASGPVVPGRVPALGPFTAMGGQIVAGPALATIGEVVNFFVTSPKTSGQNVYVSTRPGAFSPLPYACVGRPSIGRSITANLTWLACTGTDQALYAARNTGGGWPAPIYLGGRLLGSPGVAVRTDGSGTAFVEGTDKAVYSRPLSATGGYALVGGMASADGVTASEARS